MATALAPFLSGFGAEGVPSSTSNANLSNPLMAFFGPPLKETTQSVRRGQQNRNYDMVAAYEGESEWMADAVTGLINLMGNYLTQTIFPAKSQPQLKVRWNVWKFDRTPAEQVPHEVAPRLIKSAKTTHEASQVRRGQMIYLEHDFMTTPEGIELYAYQLTNIRNNINLTNQMDCMNEMMNCHRDLQLYVEQYGIMRHTPEKRADNDIEQFGLIQKAPRGKGINIMDGNLFLIANRLNIKPDTYIVPANMRKWVSNVPDGKTLFFLAGPEGVRNLFGGKDDTFRIGNTTTYEAPLFDEATAVNGLSITSRYVQTGEFYTMFRNTNNKTEEPNHRAIQIYNETLDDYSTITLEAAVNNALDHLKQHPGFAAVTTWEQFNTFIGGSGAPPGVGTVPFDKGNGLLELAQADNFPFNLYVFKPFDTHTMGTVILIKAGSETGNLLWGHTNFMIGQDASLKLITANYTAYCKAVIWQPKNVILGENVVYEGYDGGGNADFINTNQVETWVGQHWVLNTPDDLSENRPSLLAAIVPQSEGTLKRKVMDITGTFIEDYNNADPNKEPEYHYSSAKQYTTAWKMHTIVRSQRGLLHQSLDHPVNTLVARGHQRMYNHKTGEFDICTLNQGHHGHNVGPGVARVRKGMDMEFPEFDYVRKLTTAF